MCKAFLGEWNGRGQDGGQLTTFSRGFYLRGCCYRYKVAWCSSSKVAYGGQKSKYTDLQHQRALSMFWSISGASCYPNLSEGRDLATVNIAFSNQIDEIDP